MKKQVKILLALSAIILLAAACNQQPQQRAPGADDTNLKQGKNNQLTATTTEIKPVGQTQTRDNPNAPDFFPNGRQPGGVAQTPTITVTQTVEASSFNKLSNVVPAGENAIDLLKSDHKVEVKTYSGIGDFVTSIDGITPDNKHFWAFYANGKSSNVGASSYILKNADKIEWKLEAISSSSE